MKNLVHKSNLYRIQPQKTTKKTDPKKIIRQKNREPNFLQNNTFNNINILVRQRKSENKSKNSYNKKNKFFLYSLTNFEKRAIAKKSIIYCGCFSYTMVMDSILNESNIP